MRHTIARLLILLPLTAFSESMRSTYANAGELLQASDLSLLTYRLLPTPTVIAEYLCRHIISFCLLFDFVVLERLYGHSSS